MKLKAAVRETPAFRVQPTHVLILGFIGSLAVAYSAVLGPLVAVGIIVVVGALVWMALRPWTMLLIMVGSAAPLAGLRRGIPVPFLRLGEALILAASLIALVFLDRLHRQRWQRYEYLLSAYVVLTLAVGLYSMGREGIAATTENVGLLIVPVFHALAYFGARVLGGHPDLVRRGLRWLLIGSVPLSLLGMAQYVQAPFVKLILDTVGDSTNFDDNVTAGYVARATGTFNHWHLLAGYLFVMVTLGIALLLEREQRVIAPTTLVVVLAVDAVGLLLTLTYTAFIGVVAAAIIVGVTSGRGARVLVRVVLAAMLLGVLFSGALAGRASDQFSVGSTAGSSPFIPQTVQFRFQVWQEQFYPSIKAQPLLGYGPELPKAIRWTFTESIYITLLLRGGAVLMLAYALFWLALIQRALAQTRSRDPQTRAVARTVAGCAVALIPMQALFPYFTSPGLPHLMMVLAGLAFARPAEASARAEWLANRSEALIGLQPDAPGGRGPISAGPSAQPELPPATQDAVPVLSSSPA